MNKTLRLQNRFSFVVIAVALLLAAQASYAEMTPQLVQRINQCAAVHARHVTGLMANPNVVASGISLDATGEPVIKVFVTNRNTMVPKHVEGVPVHKELSSRIVALRGPTCESSGDNVCTTAERWPLPVPIGVSVGHPAVTAGTIGARVTDGSNVFILSNNHVIADLNNAILGDSIIQPGTIDGGVNSDDAIATLSDFQPIDFFVDNTIDAGIALSTPSELGTSTPTGEFGSITGYGAPSAALHPAYGDPIVIGDEDMTLLLGAAVQKVGRTTGHTAGSVTTINATVSICYDSPTCSQLATFVDQILISPGGFSGGGDSGSLIVTDDVLNQGVGLLFAGNSQITVANRIDLVLNRFGVSIDDGLDGNLRPVASFTANPTPGTLTVDLDASASNDPDGSIVSYDWDFGDGNSGSGSTLSHTYSGPGTFNIRLIVTDNQGANDVAIQSLTLDPIPGATCQNSICDNTDSGFVSEGAWSTSSSSPGYYGIDYLHDQQSGKGTKTASWAYDIAADGNYEIAAQWSAWTNRASDVQYMYSVDGGSPQNCGAPQSQRINGGQFNPLCIVPVLTVGQTLTVSLVNDSTGYVIADAMRVQTTLGGPLPPVASFAHSQVPDTLTIDFDASASNDPDGAIVDYNWDFGDGNIGTGATPSHDYATGGSYNVTLTVTGDFGATDQLTQTVVVSPPGGGVCPADICDNSDLGFDTVGTWSTSTSNPGYYGSDYLHDQSAGKGGKTASWTYIIVNDGNHEVAAQWSPSSNRAPNVQYMYSIDGGSPQNCGVPQDQRYNGGQFNRLCIVPALTAGSTFTVSIRNDSSGYVIADAMRVQVDLGGPLPPVASFIYSQVPDTLTIDFDASASNDPDGTIVAYDWDFGDGNTGTGATPTNDYNAGGSYNVTLTVTGDFGATDQVTQTVAVSPPGGGVCPADICDNSDAGFDTVGTWSTSTSNPGYYGSDYLHDQSAGKGTKTASWTYIIVNDGNHEVAAQWSPSSNRAPSVQYMYSIDGGSPQNCGTPADQRYNGGQFNRLCIVPALTTGSTFTVSIRNDSSGYVIADAMRVQVDLGGPLPPVASFTHSQVPDTLTVDFDGSASNDPDGTIVAYDWDFGDGNMGTGATPSHDYTTGGNYIVTLTVTGDFGATDQVTETVVVSAPGGGMCPIPICDNSDTGFDTTGTWSTSTSSSGYYGSNYLHDQRKGKGTKTASWTYIIVNDGNHDVAAQWPSSRNRARNVQYMYSIDGGAPENCGATADQRYNGGQLNFLCTVPGLTAGSTFTVSIRNDSSGYVIADAVSVSVQ
jgi:PKD repeat protein